MLKFAIILFILAKVFDKLTSRFVNPYKLYFIFGPKGSGKTLTETKLAVKYLAKGWTVYSDMPELLIPGVRRFDYRDLGDYVPEADSLLILSEVGIKFDKRNFKDFKPALRDFFAFQRKYKVICYMDSQSYDVDLKIRDRCDGMFLCSKVARVLCVAKRIYKHPEIIEATEDRESRIADNLKVAPFWTWLWTFIPAWVDLYDTNFVIGKKDSLPFELVPQLPAGSSWRARYVAWRLARGAARRAKKVAKELVRKKAASEDRAEDEFISGMMRVAEAEAIREAAAAAAATPFSLPNELAADKNKL